MKCSKCGNKTTWDVSFGEENCLVCPICFYKLLKKNDNDVMKTLKEIFQKPIDKN